MPKHSSKSQKKAGGGRPSIAVVGLGYVGLTTAIAFTSRGLNVTGYDVDAAKVSQVNRGVPTMHEPRVGALLRVALKKGFSAKTEVEPASVYFITVGTPSLPDGSIDLGFVKEASRSVGSVIRQGKGYQLVVVKSTVTPGTTEKVVKPLIESSSGRQFATSPLGLVMNPEFLKEGSAMRDTLEPDRLVIGELDTMSGSFLWALYKYFYGSRMPRVLVTTLLNAELIKYANNAFLATKVSYINMIANLCERLPGADVDVVAKAIGMDARIGSSFLKAGPGWGGSCWPKDLRNLMAIFGNAEVEAPLIEATLNINDRQPAKVVKKAEELLGGLKGKTVTVLGLAFKPETDDIRDAVSLKIIGSLLAGGAQVRAYDPAAMENARKVLGGSVAFASTAIEALEKSDCCIVTTEWNEFRKLKADDFKSNMRSTVVVDTRRIFDPAKLASITYTALGSARAPEIHAKLPQLIG